MFKIIVPDCQYGNITPDYIIKMYQEEDGGKNQDIDYILYKYIMTNQIKQLFITKKQRIPNALTIEIKELYDVLKKEERCMNIDITDDIFINYMYNCYIKDDTNIKDEIKEKYKSYKNIAKYADELPKSNIDYYEGSRKIKNPADKFADFMGSKRGAKVFTYHKRFNEWSWLDEDVYKQQFKQYKKLIKNKDIVIDKENNNEHILNDFKWYSLCIQRWDKEDDDYGEMTLCKGSIDVFNYMISGYVYYFQSKIDRDTAYNWLVK